MLRAPPRDVRAPIRLPEPPDESHGRVLDAIGDSAHGEDDGGRAPFETTEQHLARRFFAAHPKAPRCLHTPPEVDALLASLHRASVGVDEWRAVAGLDEKLDEAVAAGGLTTAVPAAVRKLVRAPFAIAWAEVVRHQEAERKQAACLAAAMTLTSASAAEIGPRREVQGATSSVTIAEGIAATHERRLAEGDVTPVLHPAMARVRV